MRAEAITMGLLAASACGQAPPPPAAPTVVSVDERQPTAPACEVIAEVLGPAVGRGVHRSTDREQAESGACGEACAMLRDSTGVACEDGHVMRALHTQTIDHDRGTLTHELVCRAWPHQRHARGLGTSCLEAYRSLGVGEGAVVAVRSVGGVDGSEALTGQWNGPIDPGGHRCTIALAIETGRATGRAEGAKPEELAERAHQSACAQLDLSPHQCAELTQVTASKQRFQLVDGESHAEVEVEVVLQREAEGSGRGASKLDACRAAIAEACRGNECHHAALTVRRIDEVPLGYPRGWPRTRPLGRHLFGPPSSQ